MCFIWFPSFSAVIQLSISESRTAQPEGFWDALFTHTGLSQRVCLTMRVSNRTRSGQAMCCADLSPLIQDSDVGQVERFAAEPADREPYVTLKAHTHTHSHTYLLLMRSGDRTHTELYKYVQARSLNSNVGFEVGFSAAVSHKPKR